MESGARRGAAIDRPGQIFSQNMSLQLWAPSALLWAGNIHTCRDTAESNAGHREESRGGELLNLV